MNICVSLAIQEHQSQSRCDFTLKTVDWDVNVSTMRSAMLILLSKELLEKNFWRLVLVLKKLLIFVFFECWSFVKLHFEWSTQSEECFCMGVFWAHTSKQFVWTEATGIQTLLMCVLASLSPHKGPMSCLYLSTKATLHHKYVKPYNITMNTNPGLKLSFAFAFPFVFFISVYFTVYWLLNLSDWCNVLLMQAKYLIVPLFLTLAQ